MDPCGDGNVLCLDCIIVNHGYDIMLWFYKMLPWGKLREGYPGSLYDFLQLQGNLQLSQEKKFKKLGILIKIFSYTL